MSQFEARSARFTPAAPNPSSDPVVTGGGGSGSLKSESTRDSRKRAFFCEIRLARRQGGYLSASMASASLSRRSNSARSCAGCETYAASDTYGPADCPADSSTARAKCSRARCGEPPMASGTDSIEIIAA